MNDNPCAAARNPISPASASIPAELRSLARWLAAPDAPPTDYSAARAATAGVLSLQLTPADPYTAVLIPNAFADDGGIAPPVVVVLAEVNSYAEVRSDGVVLLIVKGPWLPRPGLDATARTEGACRFGGQHIRTTPLAVAWTDPLYQMVGEFHLQTPPKTPDFRAAFALARKLKAVDRENARRFKDVVRWFCALQGRKFDDFFLTRFLPTFDKIRHAEDEGQFDEYLEAARRNPYPCQDLTDDYQLFVSLCYQFARSNPERTFFVPRRQLEKEQDWRSSLVSRYLHHMTEERLLDCVDAAYSFRHGERSKAKTYRFLGPDLAPPVEVVEPEARQDEQEPVPEPVQVEPPQVVEVEPVTEPVEVVEPLLQVVELAPIGQVVEAPPAPSRSVWSLTDSVRAAQARVRAAQVELVETAASPVEPEPEPWDDVVQVAPEPPVPAPEPGPLLARGRGALLLAQARARLALAASEAAVVDFLD